MYINQCMYINGARVTTAYFKCWFLAGSMVRGLIDRLPFDSLPRQIKK